jgi:hypothetical protein
MIAEEPTDNHVSWLLGQLHFVPYAIEIAEDTRSGISTEITKRRLGWMDRPVKAVPVIRAGCVVGRKWYD